VNLANELTARNTYKVCFILLHHEGVYLDQIHSDIPVEGLIRRGDVLLALPALIKKLKSMKPDIVMSSLPLCDLMALWACWWLGKKAPVHIISAQNVRAQQFASFKTLRSKIKAWVMKRQYKAAQAFSVLSRDIKIELIQLFKVEADKITIIPNSLNLQYVQEQKSAPAHHKWLAAGRNHKTVIAVGRLVVQKDYPTLLKALAILKGRTNTKLIILGDGPEKAAIEKQITSLGLQDRVDLAGFQKIQSKLTQVLGHIIIDLPGKMDDNQLVPVYRVADLVICPFSYDKICFESTMVFAQVVRHINPNASLVFIPNRLKAGVRYETMSQVNEALKHFGKVAPPLPDRVAFQRIDTLSIPVELEGLLDDVFKSLFNDQQLTKDERPRH